MPHISPTEAAGAALVQRFGMNSGPIYMLNLLRFRETADYTHAPDLVPSAPISGTAAYDLYAAAITPLLEASGGTVVFEGDGGSWFIGPEADRWDRVLIVRQTNLASFFSFAGDPDAMAITRHRTAALEDSRLLPMTARGAVAPASLV